MIECRICQRQCSCDKTLHGHLSKQHKVAQKDYYHYYSPRYDKNDNSLIEYKNKEQYFNTDFNSRASFVEWILNPKTEKDIEDIKSYSIDFLRQRKEKKNLQYFPSHVELKSLMVPSLIAIQRLWKDKMAPHSIAQELGLKLRYELPNSVDLDNSYFHIYADTREQQPLRFQSVDCVKTKLSCGDYTASEKLYSNVFVERKSLNDLCGTLSSGIERFQEEIERAKMMSLYLVVVVEASFSEVLNHKNNFSKYANGPFIMHKVRSLQSNNDNIQFVFGSNRSTAAKIIENIFRLKDNAKLYDLEYCKDLLLI